MPKKRYLEYAGRTDEPDIYSGNLISSKPTAGDKAASQFNTTMQNIIRKAVSANKTRDAKLKRERDAYFSKTKPVKTEKEVVLNDNTWVDNGRIKNPENKERSVKGGLANAAWVADNPIKSTIGQIAGAVPFGVAAYPFLAPIGEAASPIVNTTVGTAALNSILSGKPAWDMVTGNADWTTPIDLIPLYGPAAKGVEAVGRGIKNIGTQIATEKGFSITTPYLGDYLAKKGLGRFTAWIPFDRPITKGISWMATGKPKAEGLPVEYIASKSKGEGRKLYDVGINIAKNNGHKGLVVGKNLLSAPKSYRTYERYYPDRKQLDYYGIWSNRNMVSNPKEKGIKAENVNDFFEKIANNPDTKVRLPLAPVYRLEKPSKNILFSDYSDSKGIELFKNYIYRNIIRGKGKYHSTSFGLPNDIIDYMMHNTVARNAKAFEKEGMSLSAIKEYEKAARRNMNNVEVGIYSGNDYKNAGYSNNTGGFYIPEENFISINRDSSFPTPFALKHEARHMLDNKVRKLTNEQTDMLNEAYGEEFINIPKTKYARGLEDYEHMDKEMVTTNRDARDLFLGSSSDFSIEQQNKLIDRIADKYPMDIFGAVEKANGYGKRFIEFLRDNGGLTKERALKLARAMKYVGVSSSVPILYKNNKN